MKKAKSVIKGMAMILSMTGIIITSATVPAMASEAQPEIARTRAWDSIEHTLGGLPESVRMIEYAGSTFYLGEGVTEDNFVSFINNPEELLLKAAKDSGTLYGSPVYLLWNADKTVLLVHSMISDPGELLKTTVIPINAPASLTGESAAEQPQSTTVLRLNAANISITPLEGMTEEQTVEYMLSDEYADAVRLEFYKILNEYRSDNGLSELEANPDLQEYADIRAAEQRVLFGHERPDGSAAGSGWFDSQNVITTRYAENIAGTGALSTIPVETAKSVFRLWKNSPGHNAHMLFDFSGYDVQITMAFGIFPEFDERGKVSSGLVFATGY